MLSMMPVWLHDLDPTIWEIAPGIALRWYGLSYVLGFLIAWLLLRSLATRGMSPIPRDRAADAVTLAAICIVIGGRLGYILLYQPSLLTDFSGSFPFWGALAIHKGGMASHGGIAGAIVAALLLSRGFRPIDPPPASANGHASRASGGDEEDAQAVGAPHEPRSTSRIGRSSPWRILDVFALITPFGLCLGRLANFINGELLGRIVSRAGEPAPRWAVKYPKEVFERPADLSSEQIEGLSRAVGMRTPPVTPAEQREFDRLYGLLLDRLQSGSDDARRLLEPLINARHPSQLYQAAGEGLLIALVLWIVARKPRPAGLISGLFGVVYGAQRIVTEIWRLPDAHLATARVLGLSRGQWLSVLMVLAGLAIIAWARRPSNPPVGGWARPSS